MKSDIPVNVSPSSSKQQTIPTPGCDETDPNSLSVPQALARIDELIQPVIETKTCNLTDALNHVLASEVTSNINVPPYRNSAMDGYALNAKDIPANGNSTLKMAGTAFAGTPYQGKVQSGECIRIMTGAKVPDDVDTVVMQEHVIKEDDNITIGPGHCKGQNVRLIGEDVKQDQAVLFPGKLIKAAELGLLASLGVAEVTVKRKLKVAFFSTGDELRPVGELLEEGQIYDSNRYSIYGMLKALEVDILDLGVIPDDRKAIETAFQQAAKQADAVITSGGVSVGDADYVKETLDKLGTVNFWKIAMKPGKPLAFGKIENAMFFGLPGNPVSVMATFYQFVQPALRRMMGQDHTTTVSVQIPCGEALKKRPGRTDFQRGIMQYDSAGRLTVKSVGMQASHIMSGMSLANCFIVLPAEAGNIEAGTLVEVQPFEGLM